MKCVVQYLKNKTAAQSFPYVLSFSDPLTCVQTWESEQASSLVRVNKNLIQRELA